MPDLPAMRGAEGARMILEVYSLDWEIVESRSLDEYVAREGAK